MHMGQSKVTNAMSEADANSLPKGGISALKHTTSKFLGVLSVFQGEIEPDVEVGSWQN